jgi:hypothetical protein
MRRIAMWGGVVVVGVMGMGAEPAPPTRAAPRAMPPLPVPPVERRTMPPYLARITISGDPKTSGVFEECVDPAARAESARERARARPAGAPSFPIGCTRTSQMLPGGAFHSEMSCDPAKGAQARLHIVSDGVAGDLRTHVERDDSSSGKQKAIVVDSHLVRLGPCPADLKPGLMRRPDGTVVETGEASRLLDSARGEAP